MRLEKDQFGKAAETQPKDYIYVYSKNPRAKKGKGLKDEKANFFDEVINVSETKQSGNKSVRLALHGSIAGNTKIKKVGTVADLFGK